MREFKVSKFLTLKLEDNKTMIYVAGERFHLSKQLILNIPISEITVLEDIKSIDETVEKMENSIEEMNYNIPPEVEFWGHRSNIQVWMENNYDTRFLHSNLAFPLLKMLVDARYPLARRAFKEEIIISMF